MKKILVLGANGQLGKCFRSIKYIDTSIQFFFATSSEVDISKKEQISSFFKLNRIDYCINCAAYTKVDQAEKEKDQAIKVNITGVKNVAESCRKFNVTLIHISTDFVFDGAQSLPYSEQSITNPLSIYGKTKLRGEEEIQKILEKHYIVRTSWLYSEFGNNFFKTMLKFSKEREHISIVNDQKGTPTYAKDLAYIVIKIIQSKKQKYGIYHYSNNGQTTWYGFAKAIFKITHSNIQIKPIPTSQYPTLAKRPTYSVLDKRKITQEFNLKIPNWKNSLEKAFLCLKKNLEIETAIRASLKAGKAIMEVYETSFDIVFKDDKSPLTEADKKANDIINSFLIPTEIPIISEENKLTDFSIRKNWKECWIVDPVDGTKEFIKKNGEFTVNIAYVKNGLPKMGVIYVPASKTLYVGDVENNTAFKAVLNSHDATLEQVFSKTERLNPKNTTSNFIQVVGSRSHMNDETLKYIKALKEKGKEVEIVSKGSSLKFCLLAEGKANVYPRFAPTMEWDTAAGHAICNAVGINVISNQTNNPLLYNKESLLNPWFVVS